MNVPWGPLRRTLLEILDDHGATGTLSVALVGDGEMRRLHRDFSGIDEATDVLSFPLARATGVSDGVLGEVVVSAETALREASRRRLAPEREVALYAIHGALHLVGYDDKSSAARRVMRRKEREYLAVWGGIRERVQPGSPSAAAQRAASIHPPPRRTSPS